MKLSMNKFLPYLFALTLLSACKVSKDLDAPLSETPTAFRNAVPGDTNSIATLAWKTFFTEPGLQSLIDSAISKNFSMQIALKNMEAANLLYRQAKWNYIPDLRLQLGAGSNRPSDNSLNGISASQFLGTTHIEDFTAAVGLSWEADIWGKIRNQKKSALAMYLQTSEARKLIQTSLVSNVAKGFYNLIMLDEQLTVARRNLLLNDSTLTIIKLQFESGQVSSLAVEQASAQKLAAAQLIPMLEQNVVLQENALSILTGTFPDRVARTVDLESVPFPEQLSSGVPSLMLTLRPDVRMAELALDVANAKVGISKASLYPTLSISASSGINSFKASNWFMMPASLFG
ncbi:MAG TPA: TolC family protein, partial [Chitinophagaceae bacterium]|nr:TolC family protein [Chitinophagaceae bacterium]